MIDQQLESLTELINLIKEENIHQIRKWGLQDVSQFEWVTYLTEEVGELAQAISEHSYNEGDRISVVIEAIQVTTLALKIAEMYLHYK